MVVPVSVPGREQVVTVDLTAKSAAISERATGLADALIVLHKAPGPHLADIRANWLPMVAWRWLADGTVYLVLFVSVSGIYLWLVLRSERRTGLVLIGVGALTFFGMVYGLVG